MSAASSFPEPRYRPAPALDGIEQPRQEARRAVTRHRILKSAREAFSKQGYAQANLEEIAQHAGIAKATIYRYFSNKADLFVATLCGTRAGLEETLREHLSTSLGVNPPDQLRFFARIYRQHWNDDPQAFQIFWALESPTVASDLPERSQEPVLRRWESGLELLAQVIERGVREGHFAVCDARHTAYTLWRFLATLIGTERGALATRHLGDAHREALYQEAVETLLRGLERREPELVSAAS